MNINLGAQWETFIDEKVRSGRYLSASEVVRDGLRLLQEKEQFRQTRLEELRREVNKGIEQLERGEFREFDEQGLKEHMEEVRKKGGERLDRNKVTAK